MLGIQYTEPYHVKFPYRYYDIIISMFRPCLPYDLTIMTLDNIFTSNILKQNPYSQISKILWSGKWEGWSGK